MLSKALLRNQFKPATAVSSSRLFASNAQVAADELKYISHNYASQPIVMERGERIYTWDIEGRRYYDCIAGFGACNQGHSHPKILKAMMAQAGKITLTSRAYVNTELGVFGKYITELLGYERFIPMNTGVEADETACKMARRWAYRDKGVPDNQAMILFPNNCFWGRSITASGACDDPIRYTQFGPFTEGFDLFKYNDLPALEAKLKANPNICAVVIEPIQGEGGIIVPHDGYLQGVRDLCTKYNVLMVGDEVQTGFGRTGRLMAEDWDSVRPDIMVMGKSMSGGMMPISGCVADNHIMKHIGPGDHGSTYGGNPLAMATAHAAVKTLIEEGMVENAENMGNLLRSELENFNSDLFEEIRGRGLFLGVVLKEDLKVNAEDFAKILSKNGLLTKSARAQTIRLTPPLVIKEHEIHEIVDVIKGATEELSNLNAERS